VKYPLIYLTLCQLTPLLNLPKNLFGDKTDFDILILKPFKPIPPDDFKLTIIQGLSRVVMVKQGLTGRPYIQNFLYDQKRRNCRPSTIRSYFTTLVVFLSYLKRERGRTSLETITRDDLSSFIEDEQDRGMQPTTMSSRLRLLYAFLRYLVEREVVHPVDIIIRLHTNRSNGSTDRHHHITNG
jgi:hypothetical protein